MISEKTTTTALRLLQAIGEHDTPTVRTLVTDAATWWVLGFGAPEKASDRGPFVDWLPDILAKTFAGPLRFQILGVTSQGDRVAVEARSEGRLTNGKAYANQYHFLFTFAGDKVNAVREYNDTAYMREQLA